jgi:anti-sigma B factor antagonist
VSLSYAADITIGEGNEVVIAVSGEIDIFTAPDLKNTLQTAMHEHDGNLIIDLSNTAFIDSTALGVLIGVLRRLREEGRSLALVVATRNIARVFAVTGLDKAFTLAGSVEEARQLTRVSQ